MLDDEMLFKTDDLLQGFEVIERQSTGNGRAAKVAE